MSATDKSPSQDQSGPALDLMVGQWVEVDYTNFRGERSTRIVVTTGRLLPGDGEFHDLSKFVIEAFDIDKQAMRTFDPAHVHRWRPLADPARRPNELPRGTVERIADDPRVMAVYAAPAFEELDDDGKAWIKAIVEVAFAAGRLHPTPDGTKGAA